MMKLENCPFCDGPATDLDEVTAPEDRIKGDPIIACLSPDCPQVTTRLRFWNDRPGEKKAREIALDDARRALDGAGDVAGVNAWSVISNLMETP